MVSLLKNESQGRCVGWLEVKVPDEGLPKGQRFPSSSILLTPSQILCRWARYTSEGP